jgi:predicted ArsR family transcriptional regulator
MRECHRKDTNQPYRVEMAEDAVRKGVDRFIQDEIDSVPHLEALLLLFNSRPRQWSSEEMGKSLYVSDDAALTVLSDLQRLGLVSAEAERFAYRPSERDSLIQNVDRTYRHEVVRISRMIHAKPSAAVRDFAKAFRLKKD